MGIFDRFTHKQEIEDAKKKIDSLQDEIKDIKKKEDLKVDTLSDFFYAPWFGDVDTFVPEELLKRYISWMYPLIQAIAEESSAVEQKLYQYKAKGDEVEEINEHESLQLMHEVNAGMTWRELKEYLFTHLLLIGKGAWYIPSGNSIIIPLKPDKITAIPSKDFTKGFYEKFIYKKGAGKQEITFKPGEIVYFRMIHPRSYYNGMGVIEAAARDVNLDQYGMEFILNFLNNSASLGGVISTDKELSTRAYNRMRRQIRQKHSGIKKAGSTMFLDSGAKWQELGRTQREMQYAETSKQVSRKIMAMFRVSPHILGMVEDVNRANAEAADYSFAKRVIKPKVAKFVDQLNEHFLKRFSGTEKMFFDYEDPVTEDMATKTDLTLRKTNTIISPNEGRQELGIDPGGPELDYIYYPLNLTPINSDEDNPKEPQTPPPAKSYIKIKVKRQPVKVKLTETGQAQLTRIKNQDSKITAKLRIVEKATRKILHRLYGKDEGETNKQKLIRLKEKFGYTNETVMDLHHKIFITKTNKFIAKTKSFFKIIFQAQRDNLIAKLQAKKAYQDKAFDFSNFFSKAYWAKVIADRLNPVVVEIAITFGKDAFNYVGGAGIFDSDNPKVREIINESTFKFAEKITKTQEERLKKAINAGVKKGESVSQLTKRINGVFTSYTRFHAEMIARTEVTRASQLSAIEGYRQSGVVEKKQWYTAYDERVCDWCASMQGKVIGLEDNYFDEGDTMTVGDKTLDLDYDDVEAPPLHPQCRCDLAPIIMASPKAAKPKTPAIDDKKIEKTISTLMNDLKEKEFEDLDKIKKPVLKVIKENDKLKNNK